MELFEQIRREYEHGTGSVLGVARKFGVHRRMVREALAGSIPAQRQRWERQRPRTGPVAAFIDEVLRADGQAPRKQRHTARRIYVRLRQEMPEHPIAESTVRQYVRERKKTLGLVAQETFVPQHYVYGREAQVDWYEAEADLDGERVKLEVFSMRSMASGAVFHRAYRRGTQQAFLEAHELAFQRFGGVFERLKYDNLASAVRKVLRGRQREETRRFVAFRSHWGYESIFCIPGKEGAHEKGGVEGEVGYFRRNHWVPIPEARDLADLNRQILAACQEDEGRRIDGHEEAIGAAMVLERSHLRPLAGDGFDLAEWKFPVVSKMGTVKVGTNRYSVPLPPGTTARTKVTSTTVEVWDGQRIVACHERCYERQREILDLEHYLDILGRKPGAMAGSKPLEQWRRSGKWPASYDRFWEGLVQRQGVQAGTREMIELLRQGQSRGYDRLRSAIEQALTLGCADPAAVRLFMADSGDARRQAEPMDVGMLVAFERPMPVMAEYDSLLVGGAR